MSGLVRRFASEEKWKNQVRAKARRGKNEVGGQYEEEKKPESRRKCAQ
jgi:hypothetical protein